MPRTVPPVEVSRVRLSPNAGETSRRAVVQVRGPTAMTPEALLEIAERLRRALRLLKVTDVTIEVNPNDGGLD